MTAAPCAEAGFAARSVARTAATLPGATVVFRRHRLNFCCGGEASLAEEAAARGADLAAIEADLAALLPPPLVVPEETGALIRLIESRFHAAHRRALPELIGLARRVEVVHGDLPDIPRGLVARLEAVSIALDDHMWRQEHQVFPMLRRRRPADAAAGGATAEGLERAAAQLRALLAMTDGGAPPEGACTIWCALYAGIRALADDLAQQIALERDVLLPRVAA